MIRPSAILLMQGGRQKLQTKKQTMRLVALLALVACLALVGCDQNKSSEGGTNAPASTNK